MVTITGRDYKFSLGNDPGVVFELPLDFMDGVCYTLKILVPYINEPLQKGSEKPVNTQLNIHF
jgi:hypothetical protein